MPRVNADFLAWNRGLVDRLALARVDIDRTRLSAETYTNWIPKTQGAMRIRPGGKYKGSSYDDMPATWIDFVAATNDKALLEITSDTGSGRMRVYIDDALVTVPTRSTAQFTGATSDTGNWVNSSINCYDTGALLSIQYGDTGITLNGLARGGTARITQKVTLGDTGDEDTEFFINIRVSRGPVTFRCGSDTGLDDYVASSKLHTGHHILGFTPNDTGGFHLTLQNDTQVDRIISEIGFADTGTLEVDTPWAFADLSKIRHAQSADVIFIACAGYKPRRIERRGVGRSWSVAEYQSDNGPFLAKTADGITMRTDTGGWTGNNVLVSSAPFFKEEHVGALFELSYDEYNWEFLLAGDDEFTDEIRISGVTISGTGLDERAWYFNSLPPSEQTLYSGTLDAMQSTTAREGPYNETSYDVGGNSHPRGLVSDTGTFARDGSDSNSANNNVVQWIKVGFQEGSHTSGVARVKLLFEGGGDYGIVRCTGYISPTKMSCEILRAVPKDKSMTRNWREGAWSDAQRWPSAVRLYEGRLWWFGKTYLWASVSDDFENFDDNLEGDSRPIVRTLGEGPVDTVTDAIGLGRLLINTTGRVMAARSTSFDEPLTAESIQVKPITTHGAANLKTINLDTKGIYIHNSGDRTFMLAYSADIQDYRAIELTDLNPSVLKPSVVDIGVQRQPDTRVHYVLSDGTVALFTYDEDGQVTAWSKYTTDTGQSAVEKVAVLPGTREDQVYYHVRRQFGSGNDETVVSLLQFDGDNGSTTFTDVGGGRSPRKWTAAGNAQISTTNAKFGTGCYLGDGTGDWISTTASDDFDFSDRHFTIDGWFNCTAASGVLKGICQQGTTFDASNTSFGLLRNASDEIEGYVSDGATRALISGTTTFTDATNTGWHHVAFVRSDNTLLLFIDGALEASGSFSGTIATSANPVYIGGSNGSSGESWQGRLDGWRITKGKAWWTEAFSVPTEAYGTVGRYLERWAGEAESVGDTGMSWLADSAVSFTKDTGTTIDGLDHLVGRRVCVWANDTGSEDGTDDGHDLSYDTGTPGQSQRLYTVDTGGAIQLDYYHKHGVVGLPYTADWKSTKLAYAAAGGTALAQMKRVDKIAFIMADVHNNSIFFGRDFDNLDPLPRIVDGADTDSDKIFDTFDQMSVPFPGLWNSDSRVALRAVSPRPVTMLAMVPTVGTNDKV